MASSRSEVPVDDHLGHSASVSTASAQPMSVAGKRAIGVTCTAATLTIVSIGCVVLAFTGDVDEDVATIIAALTTLASALMLVITIWLTRPNIGAPGLHRLHEETVMVPRPGSEGQSHSTNSPAAAEGLIGHSPTSTSSGNAASSTTNHTTLSDMSPLHPMSRGPNVTTSGSTGSAPATAASTKAATSTLLKELKLSLFLEQQMRILKLVEEMDISPQPVAQAYALDSPEAVDLPSSS